MKLCSTEDTACVNFSDGYSYVPWIPASFEVKREPVPPFDLSTVLHKFTLQLALSRPFSWIIITCGTEEWRREIKALHGRRRSVATY
jgi:hypothetical protein